MKTATRIALLAAGPAAALIVSAGVASASTGPSNGQAGHLTGNHAASYTDPFFGPVQCNETQHNAFDTVSCKSTSGLPLTSVTPGEVSSVGWNSDFGATSIHPATGTLSFTVSADGLSYTGPATYPAS